MYWPRRWLWWTTLGERYHEAEVRLVGGELLLRQAVPDAPQAEACFRQALAVARRQEAKSWELRTAMSLTGLLVAAGQARGSPPDAGPEVYGWFTEGFDTLQPSGG